MNDIKLLEAQLPDGWNWQRIADRYRITKKPRELTLATFDAITFVPMEAVPTNGREDVRFEMRSVSQIASGTYFEKSDVLLSKITPSFENGKQGLATNIPTSFGVASTEIIPLQPLDAESNSRFLFYYLLHPEVRATLVGKMEGSTGRKRVPEHAIRDFPFPVPPKLDQDKIVAILRKVRRAIEVEEKLLATASELKHSAMQKLFTRGLRDELTKESVIGSVPASWQVVAIREKHRLVAGGTPSRSVSEYWKGGTIPWVKTGEVNYCVITDTEEKITNLGIENSAAKLLPKGALLLAMYGQGVTRGKVAMLGIAAATNQACIAIIPDSNQVEPRFLYYYLSLKYEELRALSHGANQQNLNSDLVGGFCFPIPDIDEQHDIVSILQTIDRTIDCHERRRETLQQLFDTLLHRLMTGDIRVSDLDIDVSEIAVH